MCTCRSDTCDTKTGICPTGCADWWIPDTCSSYIGKAKYNQIHQTEFVGLMSENELSDENSYLQYTYVIIQVVKRFVNLINLLL